MTRRRSGSRQTITRTEPPGVVVRRLAIEAMVRIEVDRAYANLALPPMLGRSTLDERDRGLVTELVYGATRMQRACDHLADRFVLRDVDPAVRAALRVGVYQLAFTNIPAHAAVSATVGAVDGAARGFVNAILRKVAGAAIEWPDLATRLSYPDWIVDRLSIDLGADVALAALEAMNQAPAVTVRSDGYTQDRGSQWVVELVGAQPGERVGDLCAAPGGKATGLASSGAWVVASDLTAQRAGLIGGNVERTGHRGVAVVVADATAAPYAPDSFDRVLVDAPCSGLGVLHRRPDARWRIAPDDVEHLAALQRRIIDAAVPLVRPGGVLVYSVCTMTDAETLGIDQHLAQHHPEMEALEPPGEPWVPHGRGALLLPQAAGTDAMMVLRLRRPR
ncbi:MAG: transcription antitermination factor NusB [Acidimicrobiales bacterium]|nr:transcription antitermination factor NusB [Acidimicrobiales bacterium]